MGLPAAEIILLSQEDIFDTYERRRAAEISARHMPAMPPSRHAFYMTYRATQKVRARPASKISFLHAL